MNNSFNVYTNSLNAIRLLAAINVFFKHFVNHYSPFWKDIIFVQVVSYIPNVPIFFSISGFLLYQSWISNKKKEKGAFFFLSTKFLRILPSIWFAFFITILMLLFLGVISKNEVFTSEFFIWMVTQLSFFQIYNPSFFRDYGVGVVNGSLWTISVIFQYYLIFIIIIKGLNFFEIKGKSGVYLSSLVIISLLSRVVIINLYTNNGIFDKILNVTIFNHLFFFILGMTIRYYFVNLIKFIKIKYLIFLSILLIIIYLINLHINLNPFLNNNLSLINSVFITFFVFIFSYIFPKFLNITNKINISFGIFIWHMIFVNFFIEYYPEGNRIYIFAICTFFILLLSYLQLIFIENKFYNYIYSKYLHKN